MRSVHAYLLSDRPGAAYAFAGTILGGTFVAIVTLAVTASLLVAAL